MEQGCAGGIAGDRTSMEAVVEWKGRKGRKGTEGRNGRKGRKG
jgi:hypothetical protein